MSYVYKCLFKVNSEYVVMSVRERAREKCWYLLYANGKERTRLTNKHQREKKSFLFFFSLYSSVSGDM